MVDAIADDDVMPTLREIDGAENDLTLHAGHGADPETSIRPTRDDPRWWPVAVPTLLTCVAVVVIAITGVRGSDYPAHYFRATQWRANPLGTWNFQWYGGHSTFSYTIIAPPLSAWIGPFALGALSAIAAVILAGRLFARYVSPTAVAAATTTVALFEIDNVIVGRVPYGFGYALMLASLLLWSHGRRAAAAGVAVTVGLASPVAAVMLILIAGTVAIDEAIGSRHSIRAAWRASRSAIAVGGATTLPLVVMAVVTSRSDAGVGYFPYASKYIVFSLVSAGVVLVVARRRIVRVGAGIAFGVALLVAIVPNPLGGNLSRYTSFVVLPVATALAVERFLTWNAHPRHDSSRPGSDRLRRWSFGLVGAGLWCYAIWFATSFTGHHIDRWVTDPSDSLSYFQPLLDEVTRQQADEPLTRLEIAFTEDHWEAAYVAPRVPYARGWERQVDLTRNGVLYDADLTADRYRQWVDDNAVGLIAVPNVSLDKGGRAEARLIDDGIDWLTLVWQNDDWRLFRVEDPEPIGSDGVVTSIDATGITIHATTSGDVSIAATYDRRLTITPGGCLSSDDNGNIVAHVDRPGVYRIVERRWAFLLGSRATCTARD